MTEPLVFHGPDGAVTLTAATLGRVVAHAVAGVDGARLRRPRRGLDVVHGDGRASVTLELSTRHGAALPVVARAVQERVADAVARTTGLEVESVDVEIAEVE